MSINDNNCKNKGESYGRTMKYLGLFGSAQGASMLFGIVRNKLTVKLIGAQGLSVIAYFNRTVQMFSDCTNFSLSFSAVKRMSEAYETGDAECIERLVKVVRSIAMLTGFVGMLLMLFLSPLVSDVVFNREGVYTERMMLLSPVVLFMAVSGGELAILRGVKQLQRVAAYTFLMSVVSLFVSVPLYYLLGFSGVFISIFLIALSQMTILLSFSLPLYAYKAKPFSFKILKEGVEMVKLGAGYMYATMFSSLAVWLVCAILSGFGENTTVGFFTACFTIIYLLPSVLFAALDSEYFPRLSGVVANAELRDATVNQQLEIQQLVQSPLLMAFAVALPMVVPLFYDREFSAVVPMTQLAMFGMFMRSMAYPISFLPLSFGDTRAFVFQETIYNICMVLFVTLGYLLMGLLGIGLGLAAVYTIDLVVVYFVARYKYAYRVSHNAMLCFILQMPLFVLSVAMMQFLKNGIIYWIAGGACVTLSSCISLYMLHKHLNFSVLHIKRFIVKKIRK